MFARIVVPVDGSQSALDAVRIAALVASDAAAALEVVTVVGPDSERDAEARRIEEQLQSLDSLPAIPSVIAIPGDAPAETLASYVARGPATLLVMSSTGRGRSAVVLGSVAADLLSAAVGPMMVVGPAARDRASLSGDVVVALDGSQPSERALDHAGNWCEACGTTAWVVTVVNTAAGAQPEHDASESGYVRGRAAALQKRLGREVEYEVLHGDSPARAIVDFAETIGAGLIAMTTHGRSGLRRVVLGSVAADVIRRAPCPVLVERPIPAATDHRSVAEE